jgi:hypothetical protein
MNLCLGAQVWPFRAVLGPISRPEQPHSSPEHTRGINQSLRTLRQLGGFVWRPGARFSPDISQSLRGIGMAPVALFAQSQWSHAE